MADLDFKIRSINQRDTKAIVDIDAGHSGKAKPAYWRKQIKPFITATNDKDIHVGYVAVSEGGVIGYILAEGRAWEFGSPLCGWIYAIGVDPDSGRAGVGLGLCREVCMKFKTMGIRTIRTMVRKDDIDVLSFFRASGFRAGPFIELELNF